MEKRYHTYFGEMHDNTHQTYDPNFNMDKVLQLAQSHLDFYAAAYYPCTSPAFREGEHPSDSKETLPLNIEVWKNPKVIVKEWKDSCNSVSRFYKPGVFVTFPGYEWQGNAKAGDHNVFFFDDFPKLVQCDTLDQLYMALESLQALAIPHHTAYVAGFRGKDWDNLCSKLSPFSEVFSVHGSSEGEKWGGSLVDNSFLAPDISRGSYSEALKRGLILGAIGSTDNWGDFPGHYGHGLAAVQAKELTRESLWQAFQERRVYALTGDRILLDFSINGKPMGSVNDLAKQAKIEIEIEGQDSLEFVELVKNEETLHMFYPANPTAESPAIDTAASPADDNIGSATGQTEDLTADRDVDKTAGSAEPKVSDNANLYKLRFEYGWGPSTSYCEMEPKVWNGKISVQNGGIESVSPALANGEHQYQHNAKQFTFQSTVHQVEADYKHHNSFVLTLQLSADSEVSFNINGCSYKLTRDELLQESRAHFYTEESRKLLSERFSVDTNALYRDDVIFGMAYKFKIFQMVPQCKYAGTFNFTDTPTESCHYRVRVKQRNGQMALSSPIWFR